MNNYIKNKADKHSVKHTFSGKSHFFEVISGNSGEKYTVSIKINCDCDYMSVQGQANGTMCSHVLAVLREIIKSGTIKITHTDNLIEKRNACKQLVRQSNREINKVRFGENEGLKHRNKKINICALLEALGEDYITEAIIDSVGLRLDILNLDNFEAIEIVDTESSESIERKRSKCNKIGLKLNVVRI